MIKTRTGKIEKQMIDLLGECLIPIKGYPFSRETTAFDLVRKHIAEIKKLIGCYCENAGVDKISVDIDTARQSLLRLIEMTDAKDIQVIHRTIYYRVQNGLMLTDRFSYKDYCKLFRTVDTSMYFIITSAITFSFDILLYADVATDIHYQSPLDWTLALWNALCYHKESFAKRFLKERREFESFIDLTDCTCEVLSFMLKELKKHGF